MATGIKTTVGELLDRVGGLVSGSSYYVQGSTPGDQSGIYADVSELRKCLNFDCFTPLSVGLRLFVDRARKIKPNISANLSI